MEQLTGLFKEVLYLGAMACVLILLLLALKKIFRKALSPKWQYYLWVVLVLRLLLPFQPPSALSVYNVFNAAAESANLPVTANAGPVHNAAAAQEADENHPSAGSVQEQYANTGPASFDGTLSIDGAGHAPAIAWDSALSSAAVVWLIGMTALGLYTAAVNWAFASGIRRRYIPLRNDRIQRALEDCRALLHIRRAIPLLTTDKARAPALYGLFRPRILVCESNLEKLGDAEIRHIFLHELSHYKRKDVAVNWLLTVLQIVYFFNPLVWYAFRKIREDSEIACDAAALSYINPSEHAAYGGTILKLVRLFSESGLIPAAAGMSINKSSLKRRILMIGNYTKSRWTGTLLAAVILTTTALTGLTGCTNMSGTATPDHTISSGRADTASPDTPVSPSDSAAEISAPDATGSFSADIEPSPSPAPTPSEASNPSPAPTTSEAHNHEPVPSYGVAHIYDGDWVVKKVLAYGSAGTYSKKDAEALIGQTLNFSEDAATIINDQPADSPSTYENPKYTEETVSESDFLTDFNMSFDKLGLSADSAALYAVSISGAVGCVLLVKDVNTMILCAGGAFFELARAE